MCVCTQTGFSGSPEMASPVSPPYNTFAPSAATAGTGRVTPRPTFMPLASDGAGSPAMASPIGSDDADDFQDADGSDAGGGYPGNGFSTHLSNPSVTHLSEMSGKADDHGHDGDGDHVDGLSSGWWGSFPQVGPTLRPLFTNERRGVGNSRHPTSKLENRNLPELNSYDVTRCGLGSESVWRARTHQYAFSGHSLAGDAGRHRAGHPSRDYDGQRLHGRRAWAQQHARLQPDGATRRLSVHRWLFGLCGATRAAHGAHQV